MAPSSPPLRLLHRPALAAAFAFGAGVWLGAQLPTIGPWGWAAGLVGSLIALGVLMPQGKRLVTLRPLGRAVALGLALALAGALAGAADRTTPAHDVAHAFPPDDPHAQLAGTWIGHVADHPVRDGRGGTRLVLALDSAQTDYRQMPVTGRVLVSLRQSHYDDEKTVYPRLDVGDEVAVTGTLRPLPHRRNPADGGYRGYLQRQGIGATMGVYESDGVAFRHPASGPLDRLTAAFYTAGHLPT